MSGNPQCRVIVICRTGSTTTSKVPIKIKPKIGPQSFIISQSQVITDQDVERSETSSENPKITDQVVKKHQKNQLEAVITPHSQIIIDQDVERSETSSENPKIDDQVVKKQQKNQLEADKTRSGDIFPKKIRETCPICDKVFKNETSVEIHVKRVHKRPNRCRSCKATFFSSNELEDHAKSHEKSNFYFECLICHLKYKREEGLKQHHTRVHSTEDAKFMCDHCGNRYKLKLDLLLHVSRAHMTNFQICRFCGKAVKDVKNHEWRHQKRACILSFDYSCELCGQKFRSSNKHDNHMLMHKEGYSCQECGIKVSGPRQLGYHKRLKHKPGMTCIVCNKIFTSSSNFYQHVLTHAGIRPYKCDVCTEDFTQRSSLLRHRKNHTGPLPSLATPTPIAEIARNYLEKL